MCIKLSVVRIVIIIFPVILNCSDDQNMQATEGSHGLNRDVRQYTQVFDKNITKYIGTQYLLYLPKSYHEENEDWPLILFLHGGGAAGEDVNLVKRNGLPKLIEEGNEFPFIILSPQHKKNVRFSKDFLEALLDDIIANYRVDEDRLYVTGLSGGGSATWDFAMEYPHRFAAIAPICGRSNPEGAQRIKHLPVWVFHGAKDELRSIEASEEMVEALKVAGGNVKFTVYPDAGHDAWTQTYENPELYEWFLSYSRSGLK